MLSRSCDVVSVYGIVHIPLFSGKRNIVSSGSGGVTWSLSLVPRGRVLAVTLTVIMVLTVSLMMLSPASAGAFPGRNGKIVFAAPDTSLGINPQIFVMNPDGTDVKELTHNAATSSSRPVWSPDGTEIAYQSLVMGQLPSSTIWVMNADGSGAHQVTSGPTDDSPDWSPDGSKIVFSRAGTGGGLYYVNADGIGTPTQLTSGVFDRDPSWSPDGTQIAFTGGATGLGFAPSLYVLTFATRVAR